MWIYGSGFPKSLDVSKAIDKAAGAERKPTGILTTNRKSSGAIVIKQPGDGIAYDEPATEAAKKWSGWGTALKPAYEPIVLARKPLDGTVAQNVLKYGTGGLNIDATRIEYGSEQDFQTTVKGVQAMYDNERDKKNTQGWKRPWNDTNPRTDAKASTSPQGRWPANVILDDEAGKLLDAQSGETNRGHYPKIGNVGGEDRRVYSGGWDSIEGEERYTELGGASRFFYCAKASREEREAGLGRLVEFESQQSYGSIRSERGTGYPESPFVRNHHPTVKPIALMRYLVKLITPPGGIVIDPFLGSGTTLLACRLENVNGFGIEREAEYEPIIKGRLSSIPPSLETYH